MRTNQLAIAVLASVLCWGTANASLVSRLSGQGYYDTATNLTWAADANLAQTSGYDADGLMTWTAAQTWIASLNAQNGGLGYLGVNNWRLPTWTDLGTPGCNYAYTGTDCSFNMNPASSEMTRLYYSTLGNIGGYDTSGVQQPCRLDGPSYPNYCLSNTGPFSNLNVNTAGSGWYWSGTQDPLSTGNAAIFNFAIGDQDMGTKTSSFAAWAVRSGDSPLTAVPVPAAAWLFGSALGLLGWMKRRTLS